MSAVAYDHHRASAFTRAECEAVLGRSATLPLTGRIVEVGESPAGPYVKLELDERWGFPPDTRFVLDLDALEVHEKDGDPLAAARG